MVGALGGTVGSMLVLACGAVMLTWQAFLESLCWIRCLAYGRNSEGLGCAVGFGASGTQWEGTGLRFVASLHAALAVSGLVRVRWMPVVVTGVVACWVLLVPFAACRAVIGCSLCWVSG